NRIVSGISRGVLVVEADERSGALITARQACDDHGRPVFAVPGRVDNRLSAGPHKLIRDGAALAAGLEDILDGLGPLPQEAIDVAQPAEALAEEAADGATLVEQPDANDGRMSENQRAILAQLGPEPADVDALVERTSLPAHVILQELTF